MTSADIALLVTAIGGSLAAILTAIAALRKVNADAARVDALVKENAALKVEMAQKTQHNTFQDELILDQQIKLQKWATWGDKMGRAMNEMQLMIGYRQQHADDPEDTLIPPARKD
jgi:hydroxyethylthiazole kinase-like sugar kinase family protein